MRSAPGLVPVLTVLAMVVLTGPAAAATGDRDPDFNGGQPVFVDPPNQPAAAHTVRLRSLAIDDAGKPTVGGTLDVTGADGDYGILARLERNGTLDSAFGTGGIATAKQYDGNPSLTLTGLGFNGGRLEAGFLGTTMSDAYAAERIAAGYAGSGVLDTDYGTGGYTPLPKPLDSLGNQIRGAMLVGSDGFAYHVAATHLNFPSPHTQFEVDRSRTDADGHLDTGWGTSNVLAYTSGGYRDADISLARDSQGRLVIATTAARAVGSSDVCFFLVRLAADGTLDPSFNGTGKLTRCYPGSTGLRDYIAHGVAIGPGNSIVVTGEAPARTSNGNIFNQEDVTTKFSADGTLQWETLGVLGNPTFGYPFAGAVAVMDDGRVVIAGAASDSSTISMARLTPAGALDTSFNGDGVAADAIGTSGTLSVGALKVDDDKLYVAGDLAGRAFVAREILIDQSLAPNNQQSPTISGTPVPGQTLTCNPGVWTRVTPAQIAASWDRATRGTVSNTDPAWTQVAAGSTYTLTANDLGSRIRCKEVATNANGTRRAYSGSRRVDAGIPALVRAPVTGGTPIVGQKLSCDVGEWTNGPDPAIQWLRDGQPIADATDRSYLLRDADRRTNVGCQVTETNDVGSASPQTANTLYVVKEVPKNLKKPVTTSQTIGGKATDIQLTCSDPGTWDEDYHAYEYRWLRAGAEIAGATEKTYKATTDDLGRKVACVVFSTNPKGRSEAAVSDEVLVPLPASGIPGQIYQAGGFNAFDPVNLMAVSAEYKTAIKSLVMERRKATAEALKTTCATGPYANSPLPDWSKYNKADGGSFLLRERSYCPILLKAPNEVVINTSGAFWNHVNGGCRLPDSVFANLTRSQCPTLALPVPPLRSTSPLSALSPSELTALQSVRPIQVLWDFDSDGQTDASCDPDAPILRSLYNRGYYKVRAVIVAADSGDTGIYSVTDYNLNFFPQSSSQKGSIRNGQPFACKTSLDPPPEPNLPCVNEVTFGRVHTTGNLCPISARRMPQAELDGLPADVQKALLDQSINQPLRRRDLQLPTTFGDTRVGGLPALPTDVAAQTTGQISALSTLDSAVPNEIPKDWANKLKDVKSFNIEKAQHAMDQIYIAKGTSYVNGVKTEALKQASTVFVPSDVGEAIDDVKKLTVSSTNAQLSLGGIPIGDPGRLSQDLQDRVRKQATDAAKKEAAAVLKGANLDQLSQSLKNKLDLGPFKLAGDAKVKLNDDGTATIDAWAELPALLTKPGSKPIRVAVQINASRAGTLKLRGVHLTAPSAFIGAVLIKDLALDYDDNGLNIKGGLLFPPVNQGININRFRLDNRGRFQELDVDYVAGAGQGINIGPGVFITKLGGGLSLNPDEVRARAGISVGPSAGGGCPTAGIDAQFVVHFSPDPFYVDATGTVGLLCIPVGDAHFYADSTGFVSLGANAHLDIGPLYIRAAFNGKFQLPRWQIDLRGDGGIHHVIEATIKALVGNLGIAGCGRIEIFPETPFTDEVDLAAGAGVRFSNGRPPLSLPELIGNLHVFFGCDIGSYSPYGKDLRSAGDGTGRSFDVTTNDKVLVLQLFGTSGAPKVTFKAPDGKTYDATQLGADFTSGADVSGLRDEDGKRTVVFLHGQKGRWTVTPAAGSPALSDVQHASVVPAPKVSGRVGGAGANRILRYTVAKRAGQVVTFVEQSDKGTRTIKVVKGGGRGRARFLTSEGGGTKRTVTAQIAQDGMPRDNIVVARFSAPSPTAGKAPHLRLRRHGSKATATWGKAFYAKAYSVAVATGDGHRYVLLPKTRTVTIGGLSKGEGATVGVTSIARSGRHGATATATLRGDKTFTSFHNKKRPKVKRHRHKRKRKHT